MTECFLININLILVFWRFQPQIITMKKKPFIKICGITKLGDAKFVIQEGTDAIGFIAYPKSPRFINYTQVETICRGINADILKVGVFVDAEIAVIEKYIAAGINTIQLHGKEPAEFAEKCLKLGETWKAIKPEIINDLMEFINYPADKFLIDAFHRELPGGTGLTVDLNLAKSAVKKLPAPVLLAGGLNPANFLDIQKEVNPFGLDFNSGLEISPGIKDHQKIKAVFKQFSE